MLVLDQKIDIRVTNNTENYFKELGYNAKNGDVINIPIEHLTKGSGLKILVICDYCGIVFEK